MALSTVDAEKWERLIDRGRWALRGNQTPYDPSSDSRRAARQRQVRLTEAEIDKLVADYHSGSTHKELSEKYGCSKQVVGRYLKKAGVNVRARFFTQGQVDEMVRLHEKGLSIWAIGKELGYHHSTVRRYLAERAWSRKGTQDGNESSCRASGMGRQLTRRRIDISAGTSTLVFYQLLRLRMARR